VNKDEERALSAALAWLDEIRSTKANSRGYVRIYKNELEWICAHAEDNLKRFNRGCQE